MKTNTLYNNISNAIILRWDISILLNKINLQKVISFKVNNFENHKHKITLKSFFLVNWDIYNSYLILYFIFINLILPIGLREDFFCLGNVYIYYSIFFSFVFCLFIKNKIDILFLVHECIITIINLSILFAIFLFYSILIFDVEFNFFINLIYFVKSNRNLLILGYLLFIYYKEKSIFNLRVLNLLTILCIYTIIFSILYLIINYLFKDLLEFLNILGDSFLLTGRNFGSENLGGSDGSGSSGGGPGGPGPNSDYLRRMAALATEQYEQTRDSNTTSNSNDTTDTNVNSNVSSNTNITHQNIESLVHESTSWRSQRNLTGQETSDVLRYLRDKMIEKEGLNRYGNATVRISFKDLGLEALRTEKVPLERYLIDLKKKDPLFFKEFSGRFSSLQYREKYITDELLNKIKNS